MLQPGERAPDFVLPGPGGVPTRFYGKDGGRPTVVVFADATGWPDASRLAAELADRDDVAACWITRDRSLLPAGVDGWVDADGAVTGRFGADPAGCTAFVLDPALRVVDVMQADVSAENILAALSALVFDDPPLLVDAQAPVLMVPRVVDAATCADLVQQCRHEAAPTGVEKLASTAGAGVVDPLLKRRSDVTIEDPAQLRALSKLVGSRLMPEITRAYAYRADRFEGFKVARYDDQSGGFFAAHRDNLTPSTAHRAFGLSINLNDEYTGGELVFPEYGNQRYRAPAGAAMVFSSSLLHLVRPVERGSRFVLLSFLYAAG